MDGISVRTEGFPIVGIGASAGGFEALKRLLQSMPEKPGVGLVIVQHLEPTKKSLAPELFARYTNMTVTQVDDEPVVKPNHIYVIPPGKYLAIVGSELRLSDPDHPRGSRMAVDHFLRSLAKEQHQCAVGIILSGTGTDGTLGIKAIKTAGGLVIAQDPASAEYDGMPRSAIDTGVVDHVLSPEEIPNILVRYAQHAYVRESALPPQSETPTPSPPSDGLDGIISQLRRHTKHDFQHYKQQTLVRRTRRRMCLHHIDEYDEYLKYLLAHPQEINALAKDLLISVTNFFREPEAWDKLQRLVIRPLVERKQDDDVIRVWTPGCATGEEPYSVAILILEELKRAGKTCPLQVFASDIDKDAIEYARLGRYPKSIEADVSESRLQRYFTAQDGDHYYFVSKMLRESVVFADQNLISDPPFSKLDLVCCRNLLIYLKPDVQEKIIALFHFALRDGGTLFLGSAETIGHQTDLFQILHKRWRIFSRTGPTQLGRVDIPISSFSGRRELEVPSMGPPRRETRLTSLAQQRLIEMLAPSAVLIDRHWTVCYICGNVDRYLTHQPGAPNDDLLEKARPGLRSKLRFAVHTAINENRIVSVTARMQHGEQYSSVNITVRLIHDREQEHPLALVMFEEEAAQGSAKRADSSEARVASDAAVDLDSSRSTDADLDDHAMIRQIEDELAATKDDLQATIEQLESSNEEFKASNEEVMSINEELQSTNEELETSKEELQSLNEELATVNNQLASKVDELETKHADLENLIKVTDVATICVDTDLTIRWFTPATRHIVRLKPSDRGRSLADFSHDFINQDIVAVSKQVLDKLTSVEDEAVCEDGRIYLWRVTPYRAEGHRIGGVVMTFVDITARKQAELALEKANRSLEQQVQRRTEMLEILQDITRAANEAPTVEAALRTALERIARYNGWRFGHVWKLTEPGADELESTDIWHSREQDQDTLQAVNQMAEICRDKKIKPGEGMIGAVFESGETQWLDDVSTIVEWRRPAMVQLGLHAAIAFPVTINGEVIAVLEFFSDMELRREERFLKIIPAVGVQLGQLIRRKRLERQIADATEQEKRRIGGDIHDGVGQELIGVRYLAQTHAETLHAQGSSEAGVAFRIADGFAVIQNQIRSIIQQLVPVELDEQGLAAALAALADRVTNDHDTNCTFECDDSITLNNTLIATHIYRIAQEAVSNAVKHAQATSIVIRLSEAQDELTLHIIDDGVGVGPHPIANAGFGLRSIAFRAQLVGGRFKVESRKEGGTEIRCTMRIRPSSSQGQK